MDNSVTNGSGMDEQHTPQRRIGSGFGATSTADDVLRGVDLTGKLAVVTGGYSGLGLETTRALAGAGAHVVVPARRPDAARESVADLGGAVEVDELDLGDLASVRGFAERFLAGGRTVDVVIDSAAIMACPETRVGPGWEAQFATNHLGHFALVNHLWPAIEPGGARVVSVSSRAHHFSGIRWDDVHWRRDYDKWGRTARPRRRTRSSHCTWTGWAGTGACGPSRCTRAASSRRCSGTCRSRRWWTGAGSTRTAPR